MKCLSSLLRLQKQCALTLHKLAGQTFADWSMRLRLSVCFTVFLLCVWLVVAVFSWFENREHINTFFDTQQMVFAKILLTADLDSLTPHLPRDKAILRGVHRENRGEQDKNALGFAVFDGDGRRLLDDGEKGRRFIYNNRISGFTDTFVEKRSKPWRIVWLRARDGSRVVAVGQESAYRNRMILETLYRQLLPWILLLPVPLIGLFWLLDRELAPIRQTARALEKRAPQDTRPLDPRHAPPEVRPLLLALNALFARMAAMREWEQAFVADAAHELRTPLAGLRIQAEVLISADSAEERGKAAAHLIADIDRCARLLEQLLTLSQLDRLPDQDNGQRRPVDAVLIDWRSLLDETIADIMPAVTARNITVDYPVPGLPCEICANRQLIRILLDNILGNAVKYSSESGTIRISLEPQSLTVENDGRGIDAQYIPRLGERFFRPPGQDVKGCGLGLSIVQRIAKIYGFSVSFHNRHDCTPYEPDGFIVSIRFCGMQP